MKKFIIYVAGEQPELVKAFDYRTSDQTLSFLDKDGRCFRQFNNKGGWNSWELIDEEDS